MNVTHCPSSRYALQPQYTKAEKTSRRGLRDRQKQSLIQAVLPQGFPTSYTQLVVSVFFLGSFIGENIINPIAANIGKRPAAIVVATLFIVAATIISQLSSQAMTTVVKGLQTLAILAGVISLVYSIYGGANVVPFHELVNSGAAAKNLLLILLFGVVLGTHSAQIKQTLSSLSTKILSQCVMLTPIKATAFDAKKIDSQPSPKLDRVNLNMVSSDEYLFSSLYE